MQRSLSAEWSYWRPGEDIYCDGLVTGLGRRLHDGQNEQLRHQPRRCGWFVLGVGQTMVRIRTISRDRQEGPALSGHVVKCRCRRRYEFEDVP